MAVQTGPDTTPTLFVRKASGLVKGWSTSDGFIYSFISENLFLGMFCFTYAAFIPGGSMFWAIILTTVVMLLEVVVYGGLISAMPRAGGDYVWQTRLLSSPIGFTVAVVGWCMVLWQWIPIYANISVMFFIKPILRTAGANGVADWLSTKNGVFVSSLAVIVVASLLVAVGMTAYAKFQKWALLVGMIGVVIAWIILAVTSHAAFIHDFNRASLRIYNVKDGYAATLKAGGSGMPSSIFGGSLWQTIRLVPMMLFWLLYPQWGATLYGEIRGAKDFRKNIWQMGGGLIAAAVVGLVFLLLFQKTMGYHFYMATSNTYWAGSTPQAGDYLSPMATLSWVINSPALQVILIAVLSFLVWCWWGTVFLSSTRVVFAAAFDRILPEKAAMVTKGGVPTVALLIMAIPSVVTSALYAYTSWFAELTLDGVLLIAVSFLVSGIAFMIMPWRAKSVWRQSAIPKVKVFGIPVMSVIASLYAAVMIFTLVLWLKDAVYGSNNTKSLIYMGFMYVFALVVWVVAWATRRRQGMPLEAIAREIPVE